MGIIKAWLEKAKAWWEGGVEHELPIREVTPAPPDAIADDIVPEPVKKVRKVIHRIKKPLAKRKK